MCTLIFKDLYLIRVFNKYMELFVFIFINRKADALFLK